MTETDVLLYLYYCLWYTSIAVISTEFQWKSRGILLSNVFFLFGLILEADNYCSLRGEEWDMKNPKRDQTEQFRVYFFDSSLDVYKRQDVNRLLRTSRAHRSNVKDRVTARDRRRITSSSRKTDVNTSSSVSYTHLMSETWPEWELTFLSLM